MSRRCQVTKKKRSVGKSYARRGIPKKKKGIGLKTTGITSRTFKPNFKKKRFWLPEEKRFVTLLLSTNAIRTISKKGITPVVRQMRAEGERI